MILLIVNSLKYTLTLNIFSLRVSDLRKISVCFNVTVCSGSLIVDKEGCLHGCGSSKTVIFLTIKTFLPSNKGLCDKKKKPFF